MKSSRKFNIRLCLFLVMLTLGSQVLPVEAAANPNPGVLPPNSSAFGKGYSDWSASWWQWAFAQPAPTNPLLDETGAFCGKGQSGHVWFLGGVFINSGLATRNCTIPAGKALFFPIVNVEDENYFPPKPATYTVAQLRAEAKYYMDTAINLSAEIDGVSLQGLNGTPGKPSAYRISSSVFSVTLPENNLENAPAGTYTNVIDDGVYLMLAPLPAGKHTLHFHGTIPAIPFTLDLTYNLTIQG